MKMDKQKRKGYSNNRSYYNKRSKQYTLETGMTGFLCTCNFREKECIRDAYKILEEFSCELYGSDEKIISKSQTDVETLDEDEFKQDTGEEEEEDISKALKKEIVQLKAEFQNPVSAKRFQSVDVGVKNVIFMSTTLPDPLELALKIYKNLDETKQQKTRFILRLVPIQVVCKANTTEIKTKADELFEKYFAQEPKTFSIIFNRHCNGKIERSEIIEELAGLISKKNPGNRANLSSPEIAVVVEIVRGFCLLSIAPDYFKYKKYNLLELCNVKELEKPAKAQEADVSLKTDCSLLPKDSGNVEQTDIPEKQNMLED
ncbi:THUMP domain-containing protein 1 homolog [Venturia canescens]|uniref:THUMP domain-containing protein 1 homolog n=1 Tax=Venturia canescens TaxID=32260 RepID=UPI001C9C3275|nr:THUMP domain-containing protein 1 homolog [Venturia canescens]